MDGILTGATPADLPMESPTNVELVVHKAMGGLFYMVGEEEKKIGTNPAVCATTWRCHGICVGGVVPALCLCPPEYEHASHTTRVWHTRRQDMARA
jgi:hypothetical protein